MFVNASTIQQLCLVWNNAIKKKNMPFMTRRLALSYYLGRHSHIARSITRWLLYWPDPRRGSWRRGPSRHCIRARGEGLVLRYLSLHQSQLRQVMVAREEAWLHEVLDEKYAFGERLLQEERDPVILDAITASQKIEDIM